MNKIDPSKLDSLSQRFLAELNWFFPETDLDITYTDRLEVVFPAKHPDVGEIHVSLDGDEITVGIGTFYHAHFETYLDDTMPKEEAEAQAVSDALRFIQDFIQDKTVLSLIFRGNQPIGANLSHSDSAPACSCMATFGIKDLFARIFGWNRKYKSYKWSGPVES